MRPTRSARSGCASPPSAPSDAAAATGGCSATCSVINHWPGGFVATVTVGRALTGWSVTMTLPSGAAAAGVWVGGATVVGTAR